MLIEVDTAKGFQDFLPPESLKRKEVRKVIEKYFELYGFLPVETPLIEFDELMKSDSLAGEDEAVSDRFRLRDRGGRNLGLRYEFTFQLSRIFKQNPNIKLPFRRYQIGENFRDEPIGPGRFRQFVQCDADIVGEHSKISEAELLAMTSDILKELKIDFEVHVNSRKLINSIIESVEILDPLSVMRELDKLDKIGEDNVKANLRKHADANQILTLFKLLQKPLSFFKDNAFDGSEELLELEKYCKMFGISLRFNPYLMRGFGYYTGPVFEVKSEKNTIAAGGRYDKVVGKYLGKEISSVGISFGLDRVSSLANIEPKTGVKSLIISIGQDAFSLRLSRLCRKEGISVIFSNDKISKALEYANSYGIPSVVFVGEDEMKKKKFKLRDMDSGEEHLLGEKSLLLRLKKEY